MVFTFFLCFWRIQRRSFWGLSDARFVVPKTYDEKKYYDGMKSDDG